jgi:hypothetical protein
LSSLDDGLIDDLEYPDPKDPYLTINCVKGDKMLVKCFLAYKEYIEQIRFTGDYMSITHASFDQFRISPANKASCQSQPPMPTSTQQNPSTSSSYDTSPAQLIRRKIKADHTLFPVMKGEKYHISGIVLSQLKQGLKMSQKYWTPSTLQ